MIRSEPSHPMGLQKNGILMVRMKSNKELNIMTTQTSNARRFSPIFVATITPGSVATRTDKNGNKYSYLTGATIAQANKESKQMTAMAFGKSHTEVAGLLRKGRPDRKSTRLNSRHK